MCESPATLRGMAELELLTGVSEVPREEWNALVGDESPFLEWEWLASLEEAGCVGEGSGWQPRPLVLREAGRAVAACPVYIKGNSEGEFVFDFSWADAAYRAGIDYYPKILVGVPFTPVSGARFLCEPGADRAATVGLFAEALRQICGQNELSGVHVNFCLDEERHALVEAGFMPRLGFQYHWRNEGFESFEDYLASLRSKRRNQVRRERRALEEQGVTIERLYADEIPEAMFEPMYRIYLETIRGNPWGRQYLNQELFGLLAERFRHRMCFIVAKQGEEIVAGTVNVQKGDALYGRYWGAFRTLRHLHFNVCYYAGIEQCIEHGLARFEPGAGGNYKQLRGFDATPTWSCHHIEDPRLAGAIENFLEAERADAGHTIDWYAENTSRKRS